MWDLSLQILSIGRLISSWYIAYCDMHKRKPILIDSLATSHKGIGTIEKAEDQKDRILIEKSTQLAHSLWLDAGKPEGNPSQFYEASHAQLVRMLK